MLVKPVLLCIQILSAAIIIYIELLKGTCFLRDFGFVILDFTEVYMALNDMPRMSYESL
jgi:hypothetical protein